MLLQVPTFSYYLTQCYQHIYLATSTLWEDNVFNTDITHSAELVAFRSVVVSDITSIALYSNCVDAIILMGSKLTTALS